MGSISCKFVTLATKQDLQGTVYIIFMESTKANKMTNFSKDLYAKMIEHIFNGQHEELLSALFSGHAIAARNNNNISSATIWFSVG